MTAEPEMTAEEKRFHNIFTQLSGLSLRLSDATNLLRDLIEILHDKDVISKYEKNSLYEDHSIILRTEDM